MTLETVYMFYTAARNPAIEMYQELSQLFEMAALNQSQTVAHMS
jgi:hypothetical protein